MKVAAVQFCPALKDPLGNLRRLVPLVTQAATSGAKLIVLPELATAGYSFMSAAEANPFAEVLADFDPALPNPSSSMSVMHALCKRYDVNIVWGLIGKAAGVLYNAQVLMQPSGKFTHYFKINKWGNDYLWASSGESNPPIHVVDSKKVGLLICRDVRDRFDQDWTDFYEKGDADIVCLSANWGDGGFPAVAWMDFAKDNDTVLVVSNRYGKEENNNFGEGGICVVYPDHKVACEGLKWSEDCIVYADV